MCVNEPERASNLTDFLRSVRTCSENVASPLGYQRRGSKEDVQNKKRCLLIPVCIFSDTPCFFWYIKAVEVLHSRTLLAVEPLSQLLALPIPWHSALLPSSISPNSSMLQSLPPKKVGNRVLRN